MMTPASPSVPLQVPKDVSISEIEAELLKIWQGYNATAHEGFPAATRAATFTLVVYEPEETQQLLTSLGFYRGPVDGITGPRTRAALKAAQTALGLPVDGKATPETLDKLRAEFARRHSQDTTEHISPVTAYTASVGMADVVASQNPCRIIALCPATGEDSGVTAQVSAYCPVQRQSRSTLICCEYVTLSGTPEALERIGGMVSALLIPELPCFLWWKATPDAHESLFQQLSSAATCVILDSSLFSHPETDLLAIQALHQRGINVADLNWRRLAAWQELTAEAFDPPERRAALKEVDQVTIDYEKGNPSQALMFLGWLASRLQWQPVSFRREGGDYDIQKVVFVASDQRTVVAELAAIPTANWGEVAGDMVGLRLMSTNLNADCCTILCSETTGCMRMEAKGGAQNCRIQQVTPLTDQQAEQLLSMQLQRWGRELLYEESLAVTASILRLSESSPE